MVSVCAQLCGGGPWGAVAGAAADCGRGVRCDRPPAGERLLTPGLGPECKVRVNMHCSSSTFHPFCEALLWLYEASASRSMTRRNATRLHTAPGSQPSKSLSGVYFIRVPPHYESEVNLYATSLNSVPAPMSELRGGFAMRGHAWRLTLNMWRVRADRAANACQAGSAGRWSRSAKSRGAGPTDRTLRCRAAGALLAHVSSVCQGLGRTLTLVLSP